MKRTGLLLVLWAMSLTVGAQAFDECFADSTLRLDYVFAGDNKRQHIYLEQTYVTPCWAGRKARLTDTPLRGNGQIVVKDHATGRQLFVHTFSTLFQEWLATEEATRVSKAFQTSYQVPFPRKTVDVTVTLTDFHNKVVCELTHTVDPTDILIRPLGPNGIPTHYVWQGTPQLNITDCIDLAIVAEGYTREQMGKFYADCQRVVDALFAHEPFTSLKSRFNVVAVAPVSHDSGPSIPHDSHWSRTPTATHYDTFYSNRYLMTEHIHRLYDLPAGVLHGRTCDSLRSVRPVPIS